MLTEQLGLEKAARRADQAEHAEQMARKEVELQQARAELEETARQLTERAAELKLECTRRQQAEKQYNSNEKLLQVRRERGGACAEESARRRERGLWRGEGRAECVVRGRARPRWSASAAERVRGGARLPARPIAAAAAR